MAYTLTYSGGTITVNDGTLNNTSTSIALPGRNYAGYGSPVDQSMVWILENFAYFSSGPPNPIKGQLWFDTTTDLLKYNIGPVGAPSYVNVAGEGNDVTFNNITATGNISAVCATITCTLSANCVSATNMTATGTSTASIVCGTACVISPIVCGTTCVSTPALCSTNISANVVCGSTCVSSPTVCGSTALVGGTVTGSTVCGTTCVSSPTVCGSTALVGGTVTGSTVCGTTSVSSPVVCGTTCVSSPTLCGSTAVIGGNICGTCICGTTCVQSPTICGTTLVCGACVCGSYICGSTWISSPTFCGTLCGTVSTPPGCAVTGTFICATCHIITGVDGSITATGTTQGGAYQLVRDINIVTTSTSSNNGVKLPAISVGGYRITVMNLDSGDNVNVYPASGANINGGSTNAAFALVPGARLDFVSISSTAWYTLNATYS